MKGDPLTGSACGCKRGIERDNCPNCEGTGKAIDWKRYHQERRERQKETDKQILSQLYHGNHLEPSELKRAEVVVSTILAEVKERLEWHSWKNKNWQMGASV